MTSTFISTRIITADVAALVSFYETVTEAQATWSTEDFAEISTRHAALAIGSTRTVDLFAAGSAQAAQNRSVILEFLVTDVDREWDRLRDTLDEVVAEPATLPWGNRSLLFRDPDGNLVNLFTPVTEQAREKFALRTE